MGNFSASGDTLFELNTSYATSGNKSAWNDYGSYDDNYLTSNSNIDLSSCTSASLTFDDICAGERSYYGTLYDTCQIQISNNGGVSFSNLSSQYSHEPLYTNWTSVNNTYWQSQSFDISSYCGQNDVRIRFYFEADSGTNHYGWLIDNVKVTATVPSNACVSGASCSNNTGSFTCSCPSGLVGDGKTAAYGGNGCEVAGCPANSSGNPCTCNSGFYGSLSWSGTQ